MNYCYTCREWTSQGGYRCKKCEDIMIDFYPAKGHYWKWVEHEFYET